MRERIDWDNLQPLPSKKRREGATKEDLAARKFNIGKAKHKGRNHLSNQKRRQIAKARTEISEKNKAIRDAKFRALKDAIGAYWRGELDEHP